MSDVFVSRPFLCHYATGYVSLAAAVALHSDSRGRVEYTGKSFLQLPIGPMPNTALDAYLDNHGFEFSSQHVPADAPMFERLRAVAQPYASCRLRWEDGALYVEVENVGNVPLTHVTVRLHWTSNATRHSSDGVRDIVQPGQFVELLPEAKGGEKIPVGKSGVFVMPPELAEAVMSTYRQEAIAYSWGRVVGRFGILVASDGQVLASFPGKAIIDAQRPAEEPAVEEVVGDVA